MEKQEDGGNKDMLESNSEWSGCQSRLVRFQNERFLYTISTDDSVQDDIRMAVGGAEWLSEVRRLLIFAAVTPLHT